MPTNGHVDAAPATVTEALARPTPIVTNVGPDQQDRAHELAAEHARKVATPTPIRADEPEPEAAVRWLTVRIEEAEYPLARALAELVDAVAPAVQALEHAGRKAAADLLVESVEMTPVERELSRLWQDIHGKPRLEHGRRFAEDD